MIKNILSIDFDYIMFPCIKLYNDMSSGGENSTVAWNNIKEVRGLEDHFLQYDPEAYKTIVKLIKETILYSSADYSVKKYAIDEHQKIVDILLQEEKDTIYDGEDYDIKYNLVNIDFHHDIMYRPQDRNSIMSFNKYNCSNWVGYLMLKDKLENYTWVKAPNSTFYDHNLDGKYKINFNVESLRLFDNLDDYCCDNNFEKIFLCLSPQWVPYKFKHLYDLIVELFGFRKG